MKIYLRDQNDEMVEAWRKAFTDTDVDVSLGDIFDGAPQVDAIVSPANSFGFMDGGIDEIYSHRWPDVSARLQAVLVEDHCGELPVGQAVIVPTGDRNLPWLVSAPTMRIAQSVVGTANAYLAFRAALLAVERFNGDNGRPIKSLMCPGLGTAIGKIPALTCARQMFAAHQMVTKRLVKTKADLIQAWMDHHRLVA